ncbi:peptidoglycan DD-metalloendopeptidase family protein [Xanthobacter sp. KR7-225]|uniref:murein hydrolase activator EnvC family protein n=1 Tax=Xanthobacter sp. KR7-225 TaxID=3156613 RepID=UPI0032B4F8DC
MMPRIGLLACVLLATAVAGAGPARAEGAGAPRPASPRLAQKAVPLPPPAPGRGVGREVDGAALKAEVAGNREFQERLRAEIEAAKGDRGKLSRLLVEASGRAREVEQRVIDLEARMVRLDQAASALDISLAQRRGVLAQVLAALLRMGREPPPALVMRPGDALDAVRSAILLGALVPELRVEAETLAADLTELSRVRGELAEARGALTRLAAVLEEDRARLAALVGERQRRQQESDPLPSADKAQAEGLAKTSGDVHDLVTRLEAEVPPAARAAEAAQAAAPPPPSGRRDLAPQDDPARLAPAIAFTDAKGLLPLPVAGVRLREFGAPDAAGGAEKGLTIATRSGAPVSAPADGWVVYAGPFRSYGQLLILNAGGGYHILLAGMDRISVELGQFVLAGEPVAVMGRAGRTGIPALPGGNPASANPASGQPQLYVEFRKDGVSIDPAPWWAAATDSRKVRG